MIPVAGPAQSIAKPRMRFGLGRVINVATGIVSATNIWSIVGASGAPIPGKQTDAGLLITDEPDFYQVSISWQAGSGILAPASKGYYWQVQTWNDQAPVDVSPPGSLFAVASQYPVHLLSTRNPAANRVIVYGNRIQVSMWGLSLVAQPDVAFDVNIIRAPGGAGGSIDRYTKTWSSLMSGGGPFMVSDSNFGWQFTMGGGWIGGYKLALTAGATGGIPLYPQLIDANTAVAGLLAGAIPLFVGDPITAAAGALAAPVPQTWSDPNPGSLVFNSGLVIALSSTYATYTTPPGAPTFNAEVQVLS